MSKELEALENIKSDLEYITRLDYVDPIVRGEVRDELYKIYHRELPELDLIENALKRLEVYETFGLLDEKYDDVDKLTDIKGKLTYVDRVMDTQERLLASVSSDEIRILNSVLNSQIRNLKKKLKAFEIIRDKICVGFFLDINNEYIYVLKLKNDKHFMQITKEEYDLLKEVLL